MSKTGSRDHEPGADGTAEAADTPTRHSADPDDASDDPNHPVPPSAPVGVSRANGRVTYHLLADVPLTAEATSLDADDAVSVCGIETVRPIERQLAMRFASVESCCNHCTRTYTAMAQEDSTVRMLPCPDCGEQVTAGRLDGHRCDGPDTHRSPASSRGVRMADGPDDSDDLAPRADARPTGDGPDDDDDDTPVSETDALEKYRRRWV